MSAAAAFLNGATALTTNDAWAVGATENLTGNAGDISLVLPVIEHWDGTRGH